MMKQALYRKWRPKTFEDIIAQEHIINSIKNQIESKTFGHAYLFSGTRGTGKTSTAKVFAKAVNCLKQKNGSPCNVCEMCESINNESLIDVIEMDAASNNSVDDIRDLRENVKYSPSKAKYKVYIIDEVHMLSIGAFNALLKTLEEPPSYVIFILATTEPHKIPDTILSRCQRYDFKRASREDLFKRIAYICDENKMEYEKEALERIIEKSDGAIRDTIGSLDQVMNSGIEKITLKSVNELLGFVDFEIMIDLINAMVSYNSEKSLEIANEVINSGKDITQFINGMIDVCRNIMVSKIVKNSISRLIKGSDEKIEKYSEIGNEIKVEEIMRILNELIELSNKIKYSVHKRIMLEMCIIKLINPVNDETYEGLISRLEKLEKMPKRNVFDSPVRLEKDRKIEKTNTGQLEVEVVESKIDNTNKDKVIQKEKEEEKIVDKFVAISGNNIELDSIKDRWNEFLKKIKVDNPTIFPLIQKSRPYKFAKSRLIIGVDTSDAMFLPIISSGENYIYISKRASQFFKKALTISFEVVEFEESSDEDRVKEFFKGNKDILEVK